MIILRYCRYCCLGFVAEINAGIICFVFIHAFVTQFIFNFRFKYCVHHEVLVQFQAEVIMTVPRVWNQFQHWSCEFMLSETTMYFIYQHTLFVQGLSYTSAVCPSTSEMFVS